MPRTALTVQQILIDGIAPSFVAGDAVNHHSFSNTGEELLEVKNTGGAPVTVTIKANGVKVGGVLVPDVTVSVPATTGVKMIGRMDPSVFNQAGGLVNVDLSSGTGITIAAFRL